MALTADEFEELKSLIGGGAPAQTNVAPPKQVTKVQQLSPQQQALDKEKAAMEQEGFFGYTGRKGLEILTGRGQGNLASNLLTGPTGLFNRIAAPLGSKQAQQEMLAAQQQAEADKQREALENASTIAEVFKAMSDASKAFKNVNQNL